ncbi:hypothetical protein E2C01_041533 [Portunus trituberculatus]|uniref:Uncharacterized protein n=1 Tax=Portunus trituberculatus TaxID=210409 RepID=A0A5B7FQM6_PORTR|nr:hypothetical protein [Portunus trituberculatus]
MELISEIYNKPTPFIAHMQSTDTRRASGVRGGVLDERMRLLSYHREGLDVLMALQNPADDSKLSGLEDLALNDTTKHSGGVWEIHEMHIVGVYEREDSKVKVKRRPLSVA